MYAEFLRETAPDVHQPVGRDLPDRAHCRVPRQVGHVAAGVTAGPACNLGQVRLGQRGAVVREELGWTEI